MFDMRDVTENDLLFPTLVLKGAQVFCFLKDASHYKHISQFNWFKSVLITVIQKLAFQVVACNLLEIVSMLPQCDEHMDVPECGDIYLSLLLQAFFTGLSCLQEHHCLSFFAPKQPSVASSVEPFNALFWLCVGWDKAQPTQKINH